MEELYPQCEPRDEDELETSSDSLRDLRDLRVCSAVKSFFSTAYLRQPVSCKPSTTPAASCSSAASNPPNSTHPGASRTPDIFSAVPLQSTHPCAPSPSNSSPRFAQCRSQSPRPRNSTFPAPPKACPQVPDRPPSSADPDVRAPASSCECARVPDRPPSSAD